MRRWILGALVSLVAAAQAESQPRAAVVADRAALRVESGGNELVALRDAPVAYARLAELAVDIAQPAEPGGGAVPGPRGRAPPPPPHRVWGEDREGHHL